MPYKSFIARPVEIYDKSGQQCDVEEIINMMKYDMQYIADSVEYHLLMDKDICRRVKQYKDDHLGMNCAKIGEYLEYNMDMNHYKGGLSGRSRLNRMFQDRLIRETLSMESRVSAACGESEKYVSAGWKRTASQEVPRNIKLKMSLSSTDERYIVMSNPLAEKSNKIEMKIVVSGCWYTFIFKFDRKRFCGGKKLCFPDVFVDDSGNVRFAFAVEYERLFPSFSSQYVVGVDVGIRDVVTVAVVDVATGEVVHSSTLSRRVQSLQNSIKASDKQKNMLRTKGRVFEAAQHRQASSRKKLELAKLVGQEIADISYIFDNALVVVEDLSWIKDTMRNGRWNRGEVVKWITHFVELNGGRVYKANAAHTSTLCHRCHTTGETSSSHQNFICWNEECVMNGVVQHRDVNAAANIAMKKVNDGSLKKTINTRRKSKKYVEKANRRTPVTKDSLKYPHRDRKKGIPTPKRAKKKGRRKPSILQVYHTVEEVTHKVCTADETFHTVPADGILTGNAGTRTSCSHNTTKILHVDKVVRF